MRIGTKFVVRVFVTAALTLILASVAPTASFAKYAALVVDADTGEVHHEVNGNTRNYPASLTKLMTLYLLFEAIDRHEVNLDTKLKISRRAARQPASKLGVVAGETIAVKDAILALIVKSANDVAVVVAENLAKSEREFALKMTAKAREIGMSATTFRNASGLPNRGQMTTARDMAKLARRIIERFPHFYEYFSTPSFTYKGVTYPTHNKMLGHYDGLDGLKTGYIRASGFNLVTSAERKYNGKLLIKPAKSSIAAVKEKARSIFKAGASLPQDALIRRLNPIIRGWGNYYRHAVSKRIFDDIDHAVWRMTWNWAKRRHPQRGRKWVKDRYYARRDGRDWVFTDGSVTLFRMATIPIRRHVKVRGDANPYDPQDARYFAERHARRGKQPPAPPPAWLTL